ncbi:DNA-binding MarR family transcriptional regulator [Arthrobacter sp. SLBN-100]|uniref:MarR family winged helix-turn-helix transcriptional regulator n=1 Tax=Arthrobacter sp. SLBN-100 TaxID=2768450 RepID=UPI001168C5FB|nr:MarR family transcriptional regulator [Arthrobacter sp. SLBN-100]TQJ62111.1 DNA-binding MarR family transcriptional regulator [Arthrobacter sp. SLBN-100]
MSSSLPLLKDPIAEARRHWQEHGWGDAADGMAAVTALMRAQQILLARIEAVLKPHGLSFARYELLALLSFTRSGSLPMAKASARLQVHPTSVTSAVNRLERAGLVRRVAHPTDGRATLVQISAKGREVVNAATQDLNAEVFTRTGFTGNEVDVLIETLGRFRRQAGDFDENSRRDEY